MTLEDQELKKVGLKVTLPRLKILQILESCDDRHMTAEDIYQSLRDSDGDVGIATVYRVLTQFEAAGLIERHNFASGPAVYEIDRGEHHDHMVCTDTGKVVEFHDAEIEKIQERIARQNGYQLVGHSLVLYVKPLD
ncbi:MAG: ferric iron uptake transcriptional regulator [Porticoccaceae bacterium]|jgi:Fur family ferric uptake transcriptional regulator|nr:MAG: Fur family transcriptional regulator [SAR92 bacterium BACL16 MAG-120619-bin48]KRP26520.1 MAG: Fur family transcriptional regulator [SAR92 bacterium BACL16 MAG-120322-bin99]MDP4653895.1 ferric iron uptake transcriptional regulator [Alphaproteobacteria bacterium]MDP4743297.1 ferric iron uptake transcriptional regulator [Porticoccaceae bacterium]MDP4752155.1 ferric iron uptake transcriptional regulator [Porticoccaceae bacterium]|tara:strand:- start:5572 stop:5979 length:408 start_codon:yes stop_codon:yes gene_type:complete